MQTFRKKTFRALSLLASIYRLLRYLPGSIWAYLFRGFDAGFSERILLAVSGVNACSYCSWFHSHMALKNGVDALEVDQLLRQLIPDGCSDEERAALLFAVHYAESNGKPDARQLELLASSYSQRQVSGILGLCSSIYFGNLSGNTFDAFLSRLRGRPSADSSLPVELMMFILCAPFLLPIMGRVQRDNG